MHYKERKMFTIQGETNSIHSKITIIVKTFFFLQMDDDCKRRLYDEHVRMPGIKKCIFTTLVMFVNKTNSEPARLPTGRHVALLRPFLLHQGIFAFQERDKTHIKHRSPTLAEGG